MGFETFDDGTLRFSLAGGVPIDGDVPPEFEPLTVICPTNILVEFPASCDVLSEISPCIAILFFLFYQILLADSDAFNLALAIIVTISGIVGGFGYAETEL